MWPFSRSPVCDNCGVLGFGGLHCVTRPTELALKTVLELVQREVGASPNVTGVYLDTVLRWEKEVEQGPADFSPPQDSVLWILGDLCMSEVTLGGWESVTGSGLDCCGELSGYESVS